MDDGVILSPITLAEGACDAEALLVLVDGRLAGVLSRLEDEIHGERRGLWFLEIGFGRLASLSERSFRRPEEVVELLRAGAGTLA